MKILKISRVILRAILFLLFVSSINKPGFSQSKESSKSDTIAQRAKLAKSPKYFMTSSGFASFTYRDFATSALFYRGPSIRISYGGLLINERIDRMWLIDLGGGIAFAQAPKSTYYQTYTSALFLKGELYYHLLYKVEKLSNSFCNVKLGGAGVYSTSVRYNQSLGNNGIGVDNLFNVMFAMKASKDISRKTAKAVSWLFFQKVLKPKKRVLCFQLNTGVLNFNYRPGYAFSYSGELNGTETNPVEWFFQDYKWSMNGWRLSTKLNYTVYLPNGNARQYAYIWDAASAPGRYRGVEMATHRLQLTILFNKK